MSMAYITEASCEEGVEIFHESKEEILDAIDELESHMEEGYHGFSVTDCLEVLIDPREVFGIEI